MNTTSLTVDGRYPKGYQLSLPAAIAAGVIVTGIAAVDFAAIQTCCGIARGTRATGRGIRAAFRAVIRPADPAARAVKALRKAGVPELAARAIVAAAVPPPPVREAEVLMTSAAAPVLA